MDQLELLWQYQQVDMDVERQEREMRQSENRQKLLKYRQFLVEQQKTVKKIENDVVMMSDRMEALRDEIKRLEGTVASLLQHVDDNPPDNIEDARTQIETVQKTVDTIARYENELAKIRKDADNRDKQQRDVRLRAARTRAEFDKLKIVYDAEYKEQSVVLEKMRAKSNKAAKGIEAAYMEKYDTIKKHSLPPMTRLNEDRCGGCNMSLPAAALNKVRAGSATVECENCGRIVIIKNEEAAE